MAALINKLLNYKIYIYINPREIPFNASAKHTMYIFFGIFIKLVSGPCLVYL